MITDKDIEALEALVEAGERARKELWRSVIADFDAVADNKLFFVDACGGAIWNESGLADEADTNFIALAANTRPQLKAAVAELKQLKAENERMKEFIGRITDLTYEPYSYLDKTQIVRDAYDLQQSIGREEG